MTIKYRGVSLTYFPLQDKGREVWRCLWRDKDGKRRVLQRLTEAEIKRAATIKARELADGQKQLTEDQLAHAIEVIQAGVTPAELAEFRAWRRSRPRDRSLLDVINELLTVKAQAKGPSDRNIRTLRGNLKRLAGDLGPKTPIASITVQALDEWLAGYSHRSPATRRNLRGSTVTLFRWARERGYLPDQRTEAERMERPRTYRKVPQTYAPGEMLAMLEACPHDYLPWLVFSAFCGLRYSELCPPSTGDKSPLEWADVHWREGFILVRPETSKTLVRRHAHFPEVAQAWLLPFRRETGRVTPVRYPNKVLKHEPSVTQRLGAMVGGWRPNALRKSFISYSCALHGLSKTARWAGNLESEAAKSYNDSKSEADGKEWFGLFPEAENRIVNIQ